MIRHSGNGETVERVNSLSLIEVKVVGGRR
jgi:hypothetical protein